MSGINYEVEQGTTWYEFLNQSIDNVVDYDGVALIFKGHHGSLAGPWGQYAGITVYDNVVEGAIDSQNEDQLLSLLLESEREIEPGTYSLVFRIVGYDPDEWLTDRLYIDDWSHVGIM